MLFSRDSKDASNHSSQTEKKVKILKNIISQAKDRGLGKLPSVEASPRPEQAQPSGNVALAAAGGLPEGSVDTAQVMESAQSNSKTKDLAAPVSAEPMQVEVEKPPVEEVGVVVPGEQEEVVTWELVHEAGAVEQPVEQAVVEETVCPIDERIGPVETVQEAVLQQEYPAPTTVTTTTTTPSEQGVVEVQVDDTTPPELTPEEHHQVVSVSIEGGHSQAHSVMLELPKDLLQCQPASTSDIGSLVTSAPLPVSTSIVVEQAEGVVSADGQVQSVPIGEALDGVILKSDNPVHGTVTTAGSLTTEALPQPTQGVVHVMEQVTQPEVTTVEVVGGLEQPVPDQHQIQQHQVQQPVLQTVQISQGQGGIQTELMHDLVDLQVGLVSDEVAGGSTLQGVVVEGSDLQGGVLPQPALEGTLKPDFDSIIMRPGDLGDVILQGNDVNSLPLQQNQMGGLVVQQSSLPMSVGSVGLNNLLTTQVDEGMLVQQDVATDFVIQQQGQPQNVVQDEVLVQSSEGSNVFLQTGIVTDSMMQPVTSASVAVQRPGPAGVVQQPSSSQDMLVQEDGLQNIILQTEEAQNIIVQEPTTPGPAPSQVLTEAPLVVQQQGQDIVIPNLDFLQGQVQTIVIDGQAYQVILQPADSV